VVVRYLTNDFYTNFNVVSKFYYAKTSSTTILQLLPFNWAVFLKILMVKKIL